MKGTGNHVLIAHLSCLALFDSSSNRHTVEEFPCICGGGLDMADTSGEAAGACSCQ